MRVRLFGLVAAAGIGAVPLQGVRAQTTPATPPAAECTGTPDPYKNYACLDTYLGTDVFGRLYNYYRLEWGESAPPADPDAPPGRRANWDPAPETTPPMPFTDWPYGGYHRPWGNPHRFR